MKIDIWLIDRKHQRKKEKFPVELPMPPQKGDVILVGDTRNYEVTHSTYHFDVEGRFTGYVTTDALSLWNCDPKNCGPSTRTRRRT